MDAKAFIDSKGQQANGSVSPVGQEAKGEGELGQWQLREGCGEP